jgi:hypothetical protein
LKDTYTYLLWCSLDQIRLQHKTKQENNNDCYYDRVNVSEPVAECINKRFTTNTQKQMDTLSTQIVSTNKDI